MRYTGIQPQYFPRLHYFARILNADIFMIRDDVQFVAKHKYPDGKTGWSYQAHTPIKTGSGIYYLRIPVVHGSREHRIADTSPTYDQTWVEDHLRTIEFAYRKSPFFTVLNSDLHELLHHQSGSVAELNIRTILWGIARILELPLKSDQLTVESIEAALADKGTFRLRKIKQGIHIGSGISPDHSASEKIVALIKAVGATEDYCGGTSVLAYLDKGSMKKNDIRMTVQDWTCREYPQLFSSKQPFIPNLSIIDLLMNVSPKEAREIIASSD